VKYDENKHKIGRNVADKTKTHIIHNEFNEESFIRQSIYGGRTLPRGKVIE
jgi:hypothetical protein